tara:strand:- start:77 stop:202 length:126 start_codon:yes stop_codon:yes gene_type:complete
MEKDISLSELMDKVNARKEEDLTAKGKTVKCIIGGQLADTV